MSEGNAALAAAATAAANGTPPPGDWHAGLPPELLPSIAKFKTPGDLAKSYGELEKKMGSAVKMPKADAPQDEKDRFYATLGRPETPDKYEFKRADGVQPDAEMETGMRPVFHKAGLTQQQVQDVFDGYSALQASRVENYMKTRDANVAGIKKEWGPDYDKNVGLAVRAIKEAGGEALHAEISEVGLDAAPNLAKHFLKLAGKTAETTFISGDAPAEPSGNAALEAKKAEIMASAAYNSRMDNAEHKAAVDAVFKINQQLTAGS